MKFTSRIQQIHQLQTFLIFFFWLRISYKEDAPNQPRVEKYEISFYENFLQKLCISLQFALKEF